MLDSRIMPSFVYFKCHCSLRRELQLYTDAAAINFSILFSNDHGRLFLTPWVSPWFCLHRFLPGAFERRHPGSVSMCRAVLGWEVCAMAETILGENLLSWLTIPMNLCSSVRDAGGGIFLIASVLLGSGDMLSLSMMCPRYSILDWWNLHLSLLRVSPSFCIRLRTSCSLWSCTSLVVANIRMLSTWIRTPGMSARSSFIFRWKCSWALLIPKGSLLKQNRPIGVRACWSKIGQLVSGT